jgi:hypothetical protein
MTQRPQLSLGVLAGLLTSACSVSTRDIRDFTSGYRPDAGRPAHDGGQGDAHEPDATEPTLPETTWIDVPDGILLWFAADRGVTADDSGLVETWSDQSARSLEASPPTRELAPHLVHSAGRMLIELDGSDELTLPTVPPFSELTFFGVVSVFAPHGDLRCPSFLHLSNLQGEVVQGDHVEFGRHQNELYYQVTRSHAKADPSHYGSFPTMSLHVVSVTHRSDQTAILRIDGKQVGSEQVPLPAATERTYNFIGNNHYHIDRNTLQCDALTGQLGELLLFERALDDEARAGVEHDLAAKWHVEVW